MTTRARVAAVAAILLALAGCGNDEPVSTPPVAQDVPPAAPTSASPSPSPSPSVSPSPLSPFEEDPAVQGMRTYLAAVAEAVNANDLQSPALVAASTPRRASFHEQLYGPDLGGFYPGPSPVVLGVRTESDKAKSLLACSVENGHALDRPGGTPVKPYEVAGVKFDLLFQEGAWKLNRVVVDAEVSCQNVPIPKGVT